MSAKHTPGPWEVDFDSGQWYVYGGNQPRPKTGVAKCDVMAEVMGAICKQQNVMGQALTDHEKEANARLIAAAPDLLEALRDIVELASSANEADLIRLAKKAQAAIAKAEGRT